MKKYLLILSIFFLIFIQCQQTPTSPLNLRWSEERAWDWKEENGWMVGTNFNPSTSINQLEFWQENTYDAETIERELEWSAELGMNLHRVYLHNLLWDQDSLGLLKRIENYLKIADSNDIKTLFVLLDDCWHPLPKLGKQPDPIPFVHNSQWVQAPGAYILGDSLRHIEVKNYIKGIVTHFADDQRVIGWDLYNEPGNLNAGVPGYDEFEVKENKDIYTLSLLKKAFKWVREVNPSQPITTSVWKADGKDKNWSKLDSLSDLSRFTILNSDIISFHTYGNIDEMRLRINQLKKYNRPILCTEYLARGQGSTFQAMLPLLKEEQVSAINWGFVAGKTNTLFPWSSWEEEFDSLPKIWHHDIFLPDKTPYDQNEIDFLKEILLTN
ncbi:MAG: 1,4-beta-xylanase [Flavobacteriaceae bacterium]|nr:1,4-beta-xylanase [Flavobacteriaceae bacterium]|tara:strand:- start:3696 stop:4844 length:1149 start_codon:yes stop_codon:yes gene_type:complete